MKIVIDIPESTYNWVKNTGKFGVFRFDTAKAIKNGTPLPKKYGRLIDADETISEICGSSCGCHLEECGHDEPCFSVTRIKSAPTVLEASKQ